jgi:dTDP-4-dehydrorhamnose reductase
MILVFGGAGQLGQELGRVAVERSVALTSLPRAQVDVADRDQVVDAIRHFKPKLVINAAGYTAVDCAEDEPEAAFRANADGPAVIARACRTANIPMIQISTDYVFDGSKTSSYVESDPVAPIGAYGRSKAAGEERVRAEAPMHLILRTSWIYGEFGQNFLKTILRLAGERDELRIVADQRGCPTSTRQIADAIFSVAPRTIEDDCRWGTYHFAGSGITTWFDFAKEIFAARGNVREPALIPISSEEFGAKAKRPSNSALDCKLFIETFGIEPASWKVECPRVVAALAAVAAEK